MNSRKGRSCNHEPVYFLVSLRFAYLILFFSSAFRIVEILIDVWPQETSRQHPQQKPRSFGDFGPDFGFASPVSNLFC